MFKLPTPYHLRQLTEYFVNYDIIQKSEEQYRARILANCLMVMTACAGLTSVYLLFKYLNNTLDPIGLVMSLIIGSFYILCLFLLKHTGRTLLISHAFVTPLYISITIASMITGGTNATSTQIMLLIPLIVFFTAGARSGFLWSVIVLGTQLIIFLMQSNDYQFIQVMDRQTQIEQGLLHWIITLSGIVGIAYVYEKAHQDLVKQRNMRESDNRFLNHHDLLTGASNRYALKKLLAHHIKMALRQKLTFELVILNINHFHQLNTCYGYSAGDHVLLTLATRLKGMDDIKILARTHGNQFTLVTSMHDKGFQVEALIAEILDVASQPVTIGHQIISLNISMGHSLFSAHATLDELMLDAEKSLAKTRLQGLAYQLD